MLPKLEFNPEGLYLKEDLIPKITEVDLAWPPEGASINFPLSADADLEMEVEMPMTAMTPICDIDFARNCDLSYSVQLSEPYQEQIRRHKKKRINKKWAKRYGFRTKYKKWKFTEVSIVPKTNRAEESCQFNEIVARRVEYLKGK